LALARFSAESISSEPVIRENCTAPGPRRIGTTNARENCKIAKANDIILS
jgi:hypothetical protein